MYVHIHKYECLVLSCEELSSLSSSVMEVYVTTKYTPVLGNRFLVACEVTVTSMCIFLSAMFLCMSPYSPIPSLPLPQGVELQAKEVSVHLARTLGLHQNILLP